ncbi:GGDEF domain-containing protein [Tropicibacter alexandrii]|uniref:GGDEF domain-containing protein n=1 Tax=Tropicibacter alexandrii TaxID=2267683 RepID=UPI000EF44B49|nr:GGDEF domain-containing protein [Tropicibacter alexandrii]
MSQFPEEMLHNLLPMHAVLDHEGRIRQAGPTLHKLSEARLEGSFFLDVFEVYRPRAITGMSGLLQAEGRKLHIRLRGGVRTPLKGILVADGQKGAIVNLSFGIKMVDAVRDYALTSTDFAPTDLAIEMLYLVEAKSAAMESWRSLNTRLQGAMVAAEERAYTDTLTGLRNRRAMDAALERQVRSGQRFSVMHIDLDFFKQVNDSMGHAAGDHVLRQTGRVMLEETRGEDTVARIGGDEFVIIFPNLVSRRRLADLAMRLIERIEKPVVFEGRECRVSASIGVAMSDGDTADPVLLIQHADEALYAAKRAGRAQFRFYEQANPGGARLNAGL